MDENMELLQCLYQDSDMGVYTLKELLVSLEGKENKIKNKIIDEINEYEYFRKQSEEKIIENNSQPKQNGGMAKMGSMMGIKKEVFMDNSDASIAQTIIEGLTMGTVNTEARISRYNNANPEIKKLAQDFLKFQQQEIETLKKFL